MTQELFHIEDKEFWKHIKERHSTNGGVYKIIAVNAGQRIHIDRFLDKDKDGILYIGKATSFIDRVIELKKSILPEYNGTGHICGRRYKANPNIAMKFPPGCLYIELLETEKPEDLETELLRKYTNIYGEVPPLNAIS